MSSSIERSTYRPGICLGNAAYSFKIMMPSYEEDQFSVLPFFAQIK